MANQNVTQLTQQTVSANATSLLYAVVGGATDTGLPLSVFVNNLGLTGVPTVPTAAVNTNTTQIASTAYVINQNYLTISGAVTTYAPLNNPTFTGTVTIPTGASISGYALLASPTFTGTVVIPTVTVSAGTINNTSVGATTASTGRFTTLQATNTITPSTTAGIVGTTLADNATAGSIGEFIQSTIASGAAVSVSSAVATNITSISLTAGDWDVWGVVATLPAGTTTTASSSAAVSTTTAIVPPISATATGVTNFPVAVAGGVVTIMQCGMTRVNVSTTTSVFLVIQTTFAVSTMQAFGSIQARRRR